MNIFSNIGITELVVILLLALLVVGPERLPEMGRKLAEILRDIRKAYDNLTAELGPELQSIQRTTQDLRESVDSVRSIPKDTLKTVVDAADLDDTIAELKGVTDGLEEVRETMSRAGKTVKDPVGSAVQTARGTLLAPKDGEGGKPGSTEQIAELVENKIGVEADEAAHEALEEIGEPVENKIGVEVDEAAHEALEEIGEPLENKIGAEAGEAAHEVPEEQASD